MDAIAIWKSMHTMAAQIRESALVMSWVVGLLTLLPPSHEEEAHTASR
jgi:hypothetical protein